MTPGQAARAAQFFKAALIRNTLLAMDRWGDSDWKRTVLNEYMVHLAKGIDPNPPPGPLGIRSGKLAGTVRTLKARYRRGPAQFTKPLKAGGIKGVRYARIHEQGGETGKDHAVRIEPRPYARPSAEDTIGLLKIGIERGIRAAKVEVYGR